MDYSLVLVEDVLDVEDAVELAGQLLAGADGPLVADADSAGPPAAGAAAYSTCSCPWPQWQRQPAL